MEWERLSELSNGTATVAYLWRLLLDPELARQPILLLGRFVLFVMQRAYLCHMFRDLVREVTGRELQMFVEP